MSVEKITAPTTEQPPDSTHAKIYTRNGKVYYMGPQYEVEIPKDIPLLLHELNKLRRVGMQAINVLGPILSRNGKPPEDKSMTVNHFRDDPFVLALQAYCDEYYKKNNN